MSKVKKAVIPAAGLGTRFLPATKALAKEMLPIVKQPVLACTSFDKVIRVGWEMLCFKLRLLSATNLLLSC